VPRLKPRELEMKRILVADDDEAIQICMEGIAEQENWSLIFASDGEECLSKIENEKPSLVILDQRMPKLTGEQVLLELDKRLLNVPVIIISAEKDLRRFQEFNSIVKVFNKPFDLNLFVNAVNGSLLSSPH